MVRSCARTLLLVVATSCAGDAGPAAEGSGTGDSADDGASSTGAPPLPGCPDCAGICLEGQCLDPPAAVTRLDPEATSLFAIEDGLVYLREGAIGWSDAVWELTIGSSPQVRWQSAQGRQVSTVFVDGDRLWLGLDPPNELWVTDGSTETVVAETDGPIAHVWSVDDAGVLFRTSAGIFRVAPEGGAPVTLLPDAAATAVTDTAIYQLEETASRAGSVVAYDLEGDNRRVIASWAGWPAWIVADGGRVVWGTSEFVGGGEDAVVTWVDAPDELPVALDCDPELFGARIRPTVLVHMLPFSASLYACDFGSGPSVEIWTQPDQYAAHGWVRGDPGLVTFEDYDGNLTLFRMAWPQ